MLTNGNEVYDESRETTNTENVCRHSVRKLNITSTFQNAENQYIKNIFASVTRGRGNWFLTLTSKVFWKQV
jgi:hypothetical protein